MAVGTDGLDWDFIRSFAALSPAQQAALTQQAQQQPAQQPGKARVKVVPTPIGVRIPETPLPDGTARIGGGLFAPTPTADTAPEDPPPPPVDEAELARQQSALDYIRVNLPWVAQLGLEDTVLGWVRDGSTPEGVVAQLRQTSQYKGRFVGINRADGTMRMNEAQYLNTEDAFRQVMHQYGRDTTNFTPADYKTLFDAEIDPNEFKDRMQTYDDIERSSDDVKAAFYVYAGMKLTTDDLYKAAVMPDASRALQDEYNQRVTMQPIDYDTWITRATEAGLDRVSKTLSRLSDAGVVGAQAISQIQALDPQFARDLTDQLARGVGDDPTATSLLSLDALQHAFQYALLGSAATASGLRAPGAERLEALRQAGVTRAKALDAYGTIGSKRGLLEGMVSRSGFNPMDEQDFEKALLLNSGNEKDLLERAQGLETAYGQRTGFAAFRQSKAGALQQYGLKPIGV